MKGIGAMLGLALLAAACGSGGTEPSSVAGTYLLTEVDAHAIPTSAVGRTYFYGILDLRGDLTFERRDSTMRQITGNVTERLGMVTSGTWSRNGTVLTLSGDPASGGGVVTATVSNNAVLIAQEVTYRYAK